MGKTLFIRIDKIGDLVLTLPVDEGVENVSWAVSEGMEFILDHCKRPRRYRSWKKDGSFFHFVKYLKQESFDEVVIFYAPKWVYFACRLAGIPKRTGRLSQWYSFLTLNNGIRQSRSLSEMHELEYNAELVNRKKADLKALELNRPSVLPPRFSLPANTYYVVHPGMAGSANNWTTENYKKLIEKLGQSAPVVVTGTFSDEAYWRPLEELRHQVEWMVGQLSGPELLSVLGNAKGVIAPSTGVLHLAASLGVPAVGVYSPVLSHKKERWGALGKSVHLLSPEVECPAKRVCLEKSCQHFDCMRRVTVENVLEGLNARP